MNSFITSSFFAFLFILNSIASKAQPAIQWSKCYGYSGNDMTVDMVAAFGGGYVLAGHTDNTQFGLSDYLIIRIDDTGSIVWQKHYGGSVGQVAAGIIKVNGDPASNNGYLVVGWTSSNDGMVVGNHGSLDMWVVKIDTVGNLQWQKCLGGTSIDEARCAVQTLDGGLVITGVTFSSDGEVTSYHGGTDIWVVKLDQSGNLLWQKALGGSYYDAPYTIAATYDGGVVVGGVSGSTDGDVIGNIGSHDMWLVKLSATGSKQWAKNYGTAATEAGIYSVVQTSDSGYFFSGKTNLAGTYDALIKLDKTGQVQWVKSNSISPVQPLSNGYIGFFGNLKRIDDTAKTEWQKNLGGSGTDAGVKVLPSNDGGYVALYSTNSTDGDVVGNHGDWDFWMVKIAPDPLSVPNTILSNEQIKIYPNPATDKLIISGTDNSSYEIHDITGRLLLKGFNKGTLDIRDLPSGIYVLKIQPKNTIEIRKFIKQ